MNITLNLSDQLTANLLEAALRAKTSFDDYVCAVLDAAVRSEAQPARVRADVLQIVAQLQTTALNQTQVQPLTVQGLYELTYPNDPWADLSPNLRKTLGVYVSRAFDNHATHAAKGSIIVVSRARTQQNKRLYEIAVKH